MKRAEAKVLTFFTSNKNPGALHFPCDLSVCLVMLLCVCVTWHCILQLQSDLSLVCSDCLYPESNISFSLWSSSSSIPPMTSLSEKFPSLRVPKSQSSAQNADFRCTLTLSLHTLMNLCSVMDQIIFRDDEFVLSVKQ